MWAQVAGSTLGGVLALWGAILQKILRMMLVYSGDLLELVQQLLGFLPEGHLTPWTPWVGIVAVLRYRRHARRRGGDAGCAAGA